MRSEFELLNIINSRKYDTWLNSMNLESAIIIKNKLQEIPSIFYETRISIDEKSSNNISLIDFMIKTIGMNSQKKNGLIEKFHINPYDIKKMQTILDTIKVVSEYGNTKDVNETTKIKEEPYGIALSNKVVLDKAYPLWLAYLYFDSNNPLENIKMKLKEDGMEHKYEPEYILGLMNHTNSLLEGKSISEKKDFYIHSINGILDEKEVVINLENER